MRRLAVGLAIGLVAAACTSAAPPAPGSSADAAPVDTDETPVSGGRLVHGLDAEPTTLQPVTIAGSVAARTVTDLIYAKLARPDPDTGVMSPDLATWEVSADGLTYRWSMDPAARWSDGTSITAEDWLVALKAVGRSKLTTYRTDHMEIVGFRDFAEGRTDEISGIRLDPADPRKWSVTFARVFCPAVGLSGWGNVLPRQVFGKYVGPGSGDAIDRAPENTAPPVASGPFVFIEWVPGDRVALKRNPYYRKGAPLLDEYVFKIVRDRKSIVLQLKSGELDRADVDPGLVDAIRSDARSRLWSWDGLTYYYLGWKLNGSQGTALRDVRVRRALAYALDVPAMIQALLLGAGVRVSAHHPPASWAHTSGLQERPFDPARAEAGLREAGFTRGADGIQQRGVERLAFTILTASGDPLREGIAQAAQESFRKIGAEVQVRGEQRAAFIDKLRTGSPDVEAWTGFWAPAVTDPDPFGIFSAAQIPDPAAKRVGNNYGGWMDPAAERAMVEARTPSNGDCGVATRKAQYAAFDRILSDQQPYLFLFAPLTHQAVPADLRGFAPGRFWPEWNIERWWRAR